MARVQLASALLIVKRDLLSNGAAVLRIMRMRGPTVRSKTLLAPRTSLSSMANSSAALRSCLSRGTTLSSGAGRT